MNLLIYFVVNLCFGGYIYDAIQKIKALMPPDTNIT